MSYMNPWMQLKVVENKKWHDGKSLNSFDLLSYYGVGLEYLLPNGKIVTSVRFKCDWDAEQKKTIYDYSLIESYQVDGHFPLDEVKFRYEDKLYQKVQTLLNLIQVGDFVKAKSRAGDYRKVLSIDSRGQIYGQAYKKPFEDPANARLVSSENALTSITEVYRNGEKIWPKK